MISRRPRRKRFIHRLRTWRVEALQAAADELLFAVGCVEFNTDGLASTLGVAKGTVYNYAESRESLLGAVLERWMSDLRLGEPRLPADPLVGSTGVLEVLCHESGRPAPGCPGRISVLPEDVSMPVWVDESLADHLRRPWPRCW